jgi:hypothetical protein
MIAESIEQAVLDWYATHCDDPALAEQVRNAVPGKREITSAGFFTTLVVPEGMAPFPTGPTDQIAFQGCGLFAPELEPYADCILHSESGRISSIEIYAVADGHPLRVSVFEVRGIEINLVDMRSA